MTFDSVSASPQCQVRFAINTVLSPLTTCSAAAAHCQHVIHQHAGGPAKHAETKVEASAGSVSSLFSLFFPPSCFSCLVSCYVSVVERGGSVKATVLILGLLSRPGNSSPAIKAQGSGFH